MRQWVRISVVLALAWGIGGCGRPASFSEVDLETARDLVQRVTVIEAVTPAASTLDAEFPGRRWVVETPATPPADLEPGPVLIVAPDPGVGYRSAAALARSGNPNVRLVIVGSAEDRRQLYARLREREEAPLDTDS